MLILGLLGMYVDAVVVFVTKSYLFFRLAVAILCTVLNYTVFIMNFIIILWPSNFLVGILVIILKLHKNFVVIYFLNINSGRTGLTYNGAPAMYTNIVSLALSVVALRL